MNNFDEMTDDQFEEYLKAKYGEEYLFMTLTQEEIERVMPIAEEKIEKAIEEELKDYAIVSNDRVMGIPPKGYFKG